MSRFIHRSAFLFVLAVAVAAVQRGEAATIEAQGDRILVDGAPLFLKGICYSPYIAGDAPWIGQYKIDFAKDLREIKEVLHANAVRIYDPLPKAFYDAARAQGLWVIQGFFTPDNLVAGARIVPRYALEPNFLDAQRNLLRTKIDLVHDAGGLDVVLAFVVGSGLPIDVVNSTISSTVNQAAPRFQGSRYKVPATTELPKVDVYPGCVPPPMTEFLSPHPYQSFICELAEVARAHEIAHYGSSHLIGHAASADTNSFLGGRDRAVPALEPPVDLGFLDIIFENLSTYGTQYLIYYGYPAYLERLRIAHPAKPVVVLETGYSTSPTGWNLSPPLCGFPRTTAFPLGLRFGGASEDEQAQALEARWVDVVSAPRPLAGFFVYSFYEEWWLAGNPDAQQDHPLCYFGLKRVRGTPGAFTVSEKPAYSKVAALFGCEESDADPAQCGVVIRSPRVLAATYGRPLDLALAAAGNTPPFAFTIAQPDQLPRGVTFDAANGKLVGKPERLGAFRFQLKVEDASMPPRSLSRWQTMVVGPPEFRTQGRQILLNGEPFLLKGIDYSPFTAGDVPWLGLTHLDPAKDLKEMRENLHANCIRVYQSVPRSVYDAARENGLFVIHGIHLQVNRGETDLFDPAYFQRTREHVLDEVNEVHNAFADDVVLAWVVGNEIDSEAQRETIKKHQDRPRYQGTYYSTPPLPARLPIIDYAPDCPPAVEQFLDPHPLQSFVAEMVDAATVLEVERYGARHLMSHATEPTSAIIPSARFRFQPEFNFPVDMGFFDIVFQNAYSYHPPYIRYFGYRNYLQQAAAIYPDRPFVILECGYSLCPRYDPFINGCAALRVDCSYPPDPLPGSFCFGKNTEEDQATGLGRCYREATQDDPPLAAGFFVFEWNDEWWKGSERSEFCKDQDRVEEWFGLKDVSDGDGDPAQCGDPANFVTRNRLAYQTVGKMFDQGWCPDAARMACAVKDAAVEISLAADDFDSAVLFRDGEALTVLRGSLTFTDRPLPGAHVYSMVVEWDRAECPPVSCSVVVGNAFQRGDSSPDGKLDITDVVATLGYLYLDGPLGCPDAGDSNDDGALDITDPIYALNFLFISGDPLPDPGPFRCGGDPTADLLPACSYPSNLCSG